MEPSPAERHSPESRIQNPVKLVEDIRYEWGIRVKDGGGDPSDLYSLDPKIRTTAWNKLFEDSAPLKGSKEAAQDRICDDLATSLRIIEKQSGPNHETLRQFREFVGVKGNALPTKQDLIDHTNGKIINTGKKRENRRQEPFDPDDAAREARARKAERVPDDSFEAAKVRARMQEETEERKQKEEAEHRLQEALAQQREYLRQEEERRKAEDEAQAKSTEEEGRLWRERRQQEEQEKPVSPSLLGTEPAPQPQPTAQPDTASPDKLREAAEYFSSLRGGSKNNGKPKDPLREARERREKEKGDEERRWLEQNRPVWQQETRQFWQEVWKLLPLGPFSTPRDVAEARANGLMRGVERVIERASNEFVKPEQVLVEVQELIKSLATTTNGRVPSLDPAGWTAFLDQHAENRSGIVKQVVGRNTERLQKARRKIVMATHPDKIRNIEVNGRFIVSFVAWFNSSVDAINRH